MIGIALLIAGLSVAGFVMVVAGIRGTERRKGLGKPPRGCADALARRVLGAQRCPYTVASRRSTAVCSGDPMSASRLSGQLCGTLQ